MTQELYDLQNDISETKNVAANHPEIIEMMLAFAEQARAELGDTLTDRIGVGNRPVGIGD